MIIQCEQKKYAQSYLFYLVDCKWGEWASLLVEPTFAYTSTFDWQECSTTCGDGIGLAYRYKIQDEQFGGKTCEGESRFPAKCNMSPCPGIETVLNYSRKQLYLC
jgi:hypothetical protein